MSTKRDAVVPMSDQATMMVAQNERLDLIPDGEIKAAFVVVGRMAALEALKNREYQMAQGQAIHDIQRLFKVEEWASIDPDIKTATKAIQFVFPSIPESTATARAKAWEAWHDYDKLDAAKRAIWDAGTSVEALYRLTQVPGQVLEDETAKGHRYFTQQEAKNAAKQAKETKRPKVAKKWAAPDGTPWEGVSSPDTLAGEDVAFSLPNGDKVLCSPVETADKGTLYTFVQLREVKPEPKHKAATKPLDASQAVKNMTAEQQAEVLAALLASMGKTLAD